MGAPYIYDISHLRVNKLENKRKVFMKFFNIVSYTYTMILNHFQLTQTHGEENFLA
jgi:hypothetical protein